MKSRKFKVEGILGHLSGGNYEFKIIVWMMQKLFEKYLKKITPWNVIF